MRDVIERDRNFMTAVRHMQARTVRSAAGPPNVSAGLEWFWQRLEDVHRPCFLDCGPAFQSTVQVLLRRGGKVYVADLISPFLDGGSSFWDRSKKTPVFQSDAFLEQLPRIPPACLSGIFCWHLLDMLPREALADVVNHLFGYLAPGGALFCLLREPYLSAGADSVWWLESPTTLASRERAGKSFPYQALTNREVEKLVDSGVVKTFLVRSGRREVVATK